MKPTSGLRLAASELMDLRTSTAAPAVKAWHALDADGVADALDTGTLGLGEEEARRRLARFGPNALKATPPTPRWKVALRQFRSPLIYILLAAAVVTLALGELIDAGVIVVVLALNAAIGFVQEHKAEKSVRALLGLLSPKARVLRDGVERERESQVLVPGDVVLLESGARVPADVRLFRSAALRVDEALLTGESLPVTKREAPLPESAVLAERGNMLFAGSVVSSGRGRGYVVATGAQTELGRIAQDVRETAVTRTPLEERMGRLGRLIGLAVAGSCAVGFALGVAMGRSPAEMFMLVVGMAVAAVPEGLPVVLTITLAVGVRRMARRQAIIRRLGAIETLGSTTVIGSDKTGTLTENRMTVMAFWAAGEVVALDASDPAGNGEAPAESLRSNEALEAAVLAGALANEAELDHGDPTEIALLVAAKRFGLEPSTLRREHVSVHEIPFESERRYAASLRESGGARRLFAKGAPERVLGLCTAMLDKEGRRAPLDRNAILEAAEALARQGLRVLALAAGDERAASGGQGLEASGDPEGLALAGLVGMMDPPRQGVPEAIAGCRRAGIRVVMITGDHGATARAIASRLGIGGERPTVLTGAELDALSDEALAAGVREVSVFARVAPDQKLRVVRALKAQGHVVAVTGDGVNDAPALKAADIGVAMGKGGTDVAREASDMVLSDDNFVSLYAAIEEGRVVFDNLRKVVYFLLSTGVAAIGVILTSLALGWPMPFLPAQLLWLNLVTNGLQDVALAFEPKDRDVLTRPPRPRKEGILSALLWERTALTSVVMTLGTLYLFSRELAEGAELARAQTVALTGLVLFQMFQVGNARSEHDSVFLRSPFSNPFLLAATATALIVHVAALHLPPTQYVLRVVPITDPVTWLRILAVASSVLLSSELHKLVRGRARRAAVAQAA